MQKKRLKSSFLKHHLSSLDLIPLLLIFIHSFTRSVCVCHWFIIAMFLNEEIITCNSPPLNNLSLSLNTVVSIGKTKNEKEFGGLSLHFQVLRLRMYLVLWHKETVAGPALVLVTPGATKEVGGGEGGEREWPSHWPGSTPPQKRTKHAPHPHPNGITGERGEETRVQLLRVLSSPPRLACPLRAQWVFLPPPSAFFFF